MLLSIALPPAFAFAGIILFLLANPDANIERESWILGWSGIGIGLVAGLVVVWMFWRCRARD
ncbi:hypothetical protein [Roseateles noduli]|uniref:hypothetical protein n=1 Tax=Roseateles noduli TaxID=2052484 RepID=UPI003D64E05F